MIVARAHPQAPTDEGWRGTRARRRRARRARRRQPLDRGALRARERPRRGGAGAGPRRRGGRRRAGRRGGAARDGSRRSAGYTFALGRSRITEDPSELPARGQRGAAGGQRRPGLARRRCRPGLRGDRRLPAAAVRDEREPHRAAALLRRDGRAAGRLRRAVRDRPGADRSRRSWRPTATSPAPPSGCSPTATRSTTGWSGCASCPAWTSAPATAARSSASA